MKECPECNSDMQVIEDLKRSDREDVYLIVLSYTCPVCNYTEDIDVK